MANAVPSWSRSIWADSHHLYLAIPTTSGEPYIASYTLSENGLSKVLDLIKLAFDAQPVKSDYVPAAHPMMKSNGYTVKQKADAIEILKKAGLL